MTRAFVVVNPAAGGGRTARAWPVVATELNRLGLAYESVHTTRRGHATDLAHRPITATIEADGESGPSPLSLRGTAGTARPD